VFTTALCAVANGLTSLAVFRALTGVFAGSAMPIGVALIGDLVPLGRRQAALGSFFGLAFLGQGLSMFIGGSIAFIFNWHWVFALYSLLAAVVTLLLYTAGRNIPSLIAPGERDFFGAYRSLLKSPGNVMIYLMILLEGLLVVGTFSYLGAYLDATFKLNYLDIGLLLTPFGFATVAGGRVCGFLARQWGLKRLIATGLVLAGAAELIFWLTGGFLWAVALGILLMGLGFIFAHSSLVTLVTEFAAQSRGAAMSLVAFGFMGGGGIGTMIAGQLIARNGFSSLFAVNLMVFLLLAASVTLFMRAGRSV
jgi:predicted MFS family arabinose efflux permease